MVNTRYHLVRVRDFLRLRPSVYRLVDLDGHRLFFVFLAPSTPHVELRLLGLEVIL